MWKGGPYRSSGGIPVVVVIIVVVIVIVVKRRMMMIVIQEAIHSRFIVQDKGMIRKLLPLY